MNQWYLSALDKLLTGDIDVINDKLYVSLVDTSLYTPDLENDQWLSSIPKEAIISSAFIEGRTTNGKGTMDAQDSLLKAVPGDGTKSYDLLVIWKSTGSRTNSILMAALDEGDEFPYFPDGSDIPIQWDDGLEKVLTLVNGA